MRRKTSVSVDEELWKRWLMFVVGTTGSTRKVSELLEEALREYMERRGHGNETAMQKQQETHVS